MTLEHVLQVIREDLRDVGGNLQPGASNVSIEELRNRTQRELACSVPNSYESLLRISDGLSWGGVAIFGTSASSIVGFPDRPISGVIESNIAFRSASSLFNNYFIFGSDGDSLLAYNTINDYFEVFTAFMTILYKFDTFEEMVCNIIAKKM